jgi:hypothetical protein
VAEIARESGYWPSENQNSRGQGNRDTISLETPGRSEPSVYIGQVSGIGRKSQIGKSEFLRTRKPWHRKFRNPGGIGTVHLGDAWTRSALSEKSR